MHPFDERLAAIERTQHGLVALHQLNADWKTGIIRRRVIERRVRSAPRVYVNASVASSYEQRVLAVVLSAGREAVASHETAARLLQLPLPGPATLEITTSDKRRPLIAGARMHRTAVLDRRDTTTVDGIPVTDAALTIYSLSSRLSIGQLGRMTDDALRRGLLHLDDLVEVVDRVSPANGRSRKKMRAMLERRMPGVEHHESRLEDFVAAAIARFELPPPIAQFVVEFEGQRRRIDHCYPEQRVALEAKGFRWYRTRSVFDRDVLRGNELVQAGFRVYAFTSAFTDWDIARQVAAALGLRTPTPRTPITYAQWRRHH